MTGVYGHQTRPHVLTYMSIVFLKYVGIFSPGYGGREKGRKQKKSGNSGFKEFPRPLVFRNGGNT